MPARARLAPALLAACSLTLAGCGSDAPTAPAGPGAPGAVRASAHAPVVHRLQGSCDATSTTPLGFTPPILLQLATAECRVSHLGRVEIRNLQRVNVVTGAQESEATWTTASGDEVRATSLGTAVPDGAGGLRFSGTTTIVGGTGRFEGARGEAAVEGTVSPATGVGAFTYDGWIAYDASARGAR